MDSYKLKFENGRSCTIECDSTKSFQDKINEAEMRYNSECVSINDKPIKKHSLGGFLVGATIGGIMGNSVPVHTISKTAKGVKRTAKKVTSTVKKQVKKFSGGGGVDERETNIAKILKEYSYPLKTAQLKEISDKTGYSMGDIEYVSQKINNDIQYKPKYAGGGIVYNHRVADRMEKIQTMSAFADQVRNFPTWISRDDLENILPDYVAGSDITKVMENIPKYEDDHDLKAHVLQYLKKTYPEYTDDKVGDISDEEYNDIFFEMVDDVREKFEMGEDNENHANHFVETYMSSGKYAGGGRTPTRKYAISGGGLAEEYIVEATNKDEAIEKARRLLKTVFGNVPKNRFSYRVVGKFAGGGGLPKGKYMVLAELYNLYHKLGHTDVILNGRKESIGDVIGLQLNDTEIKKVGERSYTTTKPYKFSGGGSTGLEVFNLGGDAYDGGIVWEVRQNGKVIEQGLIDGEWGIKFQGKEYKGLVDLAKQIKAPLHVVEDNKVYQPEELENFAGGGGVEKTPRWWNKQVREYEFFVFNTETNKVWAGNEYLNDAKDELKEFLLDNPKLPLKVLSKRAITNKKINPLAYENWARSSEQFEAIKSSGLTPEKMARGSKVKSQTNDSRIKDLVKDLENTPYSIGLAILRERLLTYSENDLRSLEKNPDAWSNPIISLGMYKDYYSRVAKELSFDSGKDNTKAVKGLVKDLENTPYSIGLAILRERLLTYAENDLKAMQKNPDAWSNPFISLGMYKDYANRVIDNLKFEFADGGMSSMAVAGAMPELAIADEVSKRLPETTSAIDRRIASRLDPNRPKWYEDRGLQPTYATGGMVGRDITFDRWGEHKVGTITEVLPDGNFSVSSGMGSYLVSPDNVISFSAEKQEKKGWFFAKGGSTGYNYSWHFDHNRHNKSESYEVPKSERKKYSGGGGLPKGKYMVLSELYDLKYKLGHTDVILNGRKESIGDVIGLQLNDTEIKKVGERSYTTSKPYKFSGGGKTPQRYQILSPDGFPLYRDRTFTEEEILPAFEEWKKRYEKQGYYSTSNRERIDLDDLGDMVSVIEVSDEDYED